MDNTTINLSANYHRHNYSIAQCICKGLHPFIGLLLYVVIVLCIICKTLLCCNTLLPRQFTTRSQSFAGKPAFTVYTIQHPFSGTPRFDQIYYNDEGSWDVSAQNFTATSDGLFCFTLSAAKHYLAEYVNWYLVQRSSAGTEKAKRGLQLYDNVERSLETGSATVIWAMAQGDAVSVGYERGTAWCDADN